MVAMPNRVVGPSSSSSSSLQRHQQHVSSFQKNRSQLLNNNSDNGKNQHHPHGHSRNGNNRGVNSNSNTNNNTSTALEAAGIQQSLARTQKLLQHGMEQVSHVATAILDDGKLLQETTNLHKSLNVTGAKKALTALERAQQREQRLLFWSVTFFWLVVLYIAWERIVLHLPLVNRTILWMARLLSAAIAPSGTSDGGGKK